MNNSTLKTSAAIAAVILGATLILLYFLWKKNSHVCLPDGHIAVTQGNSLSLCGSELADKLDNIRKKLTNCACNPVLLRKAIGNVERFILANGKMINFDVLDQNMKAIAEDSEPTPRILLEVYLINASSLIRAKKCNGMIDLNLLETLVGGSSVGSSETYLLMSKENFEPKDIFEQVTGVPQEKPSQLDEMRQKIKFQPGVSLISTRRLGLSEKSAPPSRILSSMSGQELNREKSALVEVSDLSLMHQAETNPGKVFDVPTDDRTKLFGYNIY
jgi:hypothetical protein